MYATMGISYKKEIEFHEVIFIGFTNIAITYKQ